MSKTVTIGSDLNNRKFDNYYVHRLMAMEAVVRMLLEGIESRGDQALYSLHIVGTMAYDKAAEQAEELGEYVKSLESKLHEQTLELGQRTSTTDQKTRP